PDFASLHPGLRPLPLPAAWLTMYAPNTDIELVRETAGDCRSNHQGRNPMNRHSILSLSAVTVLGLAVLPGSAVSQQKTLKDQLVGTWTLTSWEQDGGQTGPKFQRFGANPKGYNIFDASGRF